MIAEITAALLTIVGASAALGAKHLMRGVLGLAVFFLGIASFFGILGAWFLAVGQIFLFIGGVVTLFVLAFNFTKQPGNRHTWPAASFTALAVIGLLAWYLPLHVQYRASTTATEFATHFFITYGWALNLAILLLFSAVITAQYLLTEDS